jgi:uncharacterized protein YfaP (DUF2135 family)
MDCWPPCSLWCVCNNGVCEPAAIAVNAIRLRTPDGRYLQAVNGGGAGLFAVSVASPGQWETFRFVQPPTTWPIANGGPLSMNLCNSNWDPSGMLVRVDHGVKTWPPRKGSTRLVSYEIGGTGQAVWAIAGFSAGYPAYPGDDPQERIFDIVKSSGATINHGDLVSLRINSNWGKTFFFRVGGGNSGAGIFGDGAAAGDAGTVFVVEFVEVRSGVGVRPPVVQCQTCAAVMGTITRSAGGQPIAGAQGEALDVLENHPFNATTASNGSYTLSDPDGRTCIPAGTIKVRASANRYKTKTIDPVVVPGGGNVNLPIQLDCTQVKVKVVDSASLGIAGVPVMLLDAAGNLLLDLNGQPFIANTGLDGSVTFNCVPHGNVRVQTTADPNQQPQINVPPDGAAVTIVVQNTCGNLIGKVVTDLLTSTGIPNATVTIVGTSQQTTTDSNGAFRFNCVRPAGQRTVLASAPACGFNTGTGNVPTSGDSSQVVIPLNCAAAIVNSIVAILQWSMQPSDLDAHLSGPDGQGGRFHLYYGNRLQPPVPFVNLDTDDVDSTGPEVLTINRSAGAFVAGEYRVWIHNYSASTFAGSSAVVAVVRLDPQGIPTQLAREEVQFATGDPADDIWHVVNLTVDAAGSVNVVVVQTLQPGGSSMIL